MIITTEYSKMAGEAISQYFSIDDVLIRSLNAVKT